MSYGTPEVLKMASGIMADLGNPTDISIGYVSGWITSSGGMLGEVNFRLSIYTHLTGDSPTIENFGDQEESIARLFFKRDYYEKRSLAALTATTMPWTNIKDGDSSITRESSVAISKAFNTLYINADNQSKVAVANWKRSNTNLATVDAMTLYSWPSP
jgi:hypothetical protein